MNKVQRVAVGGLVQVDATGNGKMVFGKIIDIDAKSGKVSIEPSDGSAELVVARVDLFKATQAELNKFSGSKSAAKTNAATPTKEKAKAARTEAKSNDEDAEAEDGHSLVPEKYRANYKKDVLPSGRSTLNNGDKVAKELSGKTLEEVKQHVASKMGTNAAFFTKKYGHLNRGHQRMLIGQAYRAHLNKPKE